MSLDAAAKAKPRMQRHFQELMISRGFDPKTEAQPTTFPLVSVLLSSD
jgi:hypothetical protein